MNLLHVLKRDLKGWPPGRFIAHQSYWGCVFFLDGPAEWDNGGWHYSTDLYRIDGPILEPSSDREWASVTKSQWEAA